jgi:cell wall-associated NlpC family hydrolase
MGGLALSDAVSRAAVAQSGAPAGPRSAPRFGRLTLVLLAFALAVTLVGVEGPESAQAATSQAGKIVYSAKTHLGKPFRLGTEGLRKFDCSGLVWRVFYQNGLVTKIGGSRKLARGYYEWFRSRGLASRSNPRVGDLVVWGRARHIGIYVGDGKAVSALTGGVARHGVHRINLNFTAYLHVRINR